MGKRLYVAKRYEVEWGEVTAFNYNHFAFFCLLKALGGEPSYNNGDSDYICDDFECAVEDYDDAIANLEVFIADPHLLSESDVIAEKLKDVGKSAEDVLSIMKRYRSEADVHTGYLHFSAF